MLRIGQLKIKPNHTIEDLVQKIIKTLRISERELISYQIVKQSIDARKKQDIKYVYTIDVMIANEASVLKHQKNNVVSAISVKEYQFPTYGEETLSKRPIIIGAGPAGLFCAYMLAKHGYKPLLFERGKSVEEREKDIARFWETGILDTNSNVQFGEGGAGTFSDGKLNTLVKDPSGRNKKVLEIFVENGAPEEILYVNKPHIGTDILMDVVRNIRNQILSWGGAIEFESCFTNLQTENGQLTSIEITNNGIKKQIDTNLLILAIGHSARDTFSMLYKKNLPMKAKAFAVGVRVEHLQSMIQRAQYGEQCPYQLPTASYKVTTNLENGRGVYSFCMCPGGYVVNASSENGRLAVNGMSYHTRDGINANSAIIVTVSPEDYGDSHPLSGMEFQRHLEEKAYQLGEGKVPVQCYIDFCENRITRAIGKVTPQIKGEYVYANVREIFPNEIAESIALGIKAFDKMIPGFADNDTILSGVESRTSSPIRIERNENLEIDHSGIYPCGEGAGYAGGITSAAMDGIKIAEMIAKKYRPFDSE